MANIRTLQMSFNGGELTPEMFGQIGDAKYRSGAALLRNFLVLPHGPAQNRPGFAFVHEVKTSSKKTRLIPFEFNTTQTMVLEIGDQYIRFHTNGGTVLSGGSPYEISTPYLEADLFDLHYVQSADVLTIVHPNYAPRELRRLGATSWALTTISFVSALSAPGSVTATPHVPSGAPTDVQHYKVTTVGADGLDESLASADASCTNNLLVTNAYNTITWSAATGAVRYNIYKQSNGALYGYIGQSDGTTFIDDNITADISKTPPLQYDPFSGSGNYPGAVSYYEQRRCFAGTTNKPQNIWMTRSGTESSLSYSLPTRDDDSINFRVAAREANTIRHIVPLTSLVLLTSSAEWRVTSVNSDAITPSTVSVRPQSYIGASNVQPEIINNQMLYAAARGGHMRELAYSWQSSGFVTGDLSLRAPHLFDGFDILDMTYSKAPTPIVWAVSSSGNLLGFTYVPEQQVGAWHHHDTDGTFESVTSVTEGNEDVVYCVVKRTVNGATKRYVERMASRLFASQPDAFFVDCGSTYDGTNTALVSMIVTGGTTWGPGETLTITSSVAKFSYPGTSDVDDVIEMTSNDGSKYRLRIISTSSTQIATVQPDRVLPADLRATTTINWSFARNSISGLGYLEGKTVNVLADGAVHPKCVVASGQITLQRAATKVHVGLPITADLQTLPWAAQVDAGFGQGRMKNVNRVWLRVNKSSGIFVGPTLDHLTEHKQRTVEPYGSPPALKSEELRIDITPTWADAGQVFVRQSDPLPLTIVSMTLEVALGA